MAVPGNQIQLHQSLVRPILLMGAPRSFAIINATIGLALVLGLHIIFIFPLFIFTHITAMIFSKKDPNFFDVMLRHLRQKRYYDV